jgi:hypothetical protein
MVLVICTSNVVGVLFSSLYRIVVEDKDTGGNNNRL